MTDSSDASLAGRHLLIDFWQAKRLDDPDHIVGALRQGAEAAGATVLDVRHHRFGEGGGVTAVALLAESHITIHTWPERGYAAIDVFVCGEARADDAVPVLLAAFGPGSHRITGHWRGAETSGNEAV